ncbi:MAG: hypothetical protein MUE30_10430 [Spirosomaceae bacterium]|jgi:hypothetical protein|nr:hypothetical protein [Spirosomataceae bacterium]
MQTILIEVTHPKGMALLRDLEELDVIRMIQQDKPKQKLSEIFAGCITPEEANKLNEYVKNSRNEWERDI